MKKIFEVADKIIIILCILLLALWIYPLTMEKDGEDYTCRNIFGRIVNCD